MPELDLEAVLRDVPRPSFKQELRKSMETQTITPYIVTTRLEELVAFVKEAFGGEELLRARGSAGGTHCEVRIGDSKLMIGSGGATEMPTSLHYYVRDVDTMYRRAIEAGAESLKAPVDQEYGDRDCALKDAAGNEWYLATSRGPRHKPEGLRDVTTYLHPHGVDRLLQFMTDAFGAETLERYASPEGVIAHAKVKVGNSVIEMGEAHGQWQPMPTMIYLQVEDTDTSYERAMAQGAKSIMPPSNQPYGARMAGVEDSAGNQWYLAMPIK